MKEKAFINKKNFSAMVLLAFCFTACSADHNIQQTTISEPTTIAEVSDTSTETTQESTSAAESMDMTVENTQENTASETNETFIEISTESEITKDNWQNPEEGLVFFVQPSISQRDEDSTVDDWECRDTEVLHDFHYDGEWNYSKELIFVFSNYTDEPVTIDSINIVSDAEDTPVKFNDGSLFLDINLTVQPQHKTDYVLRAEDFDYSACESGIYHAVANIGLEGYGRDFFINNSACTLFEPYVYAPTFLNEEQQQIFAQAHTTMRDWFWCITMMHPSYSEAHTPDDFMTMLKEVFTKEYAKELAAIYIDEDGNFQNTGGERGGDISYHSHCFIPVSADENKVEFKAVATYAHPDNPYKVRFVDKHFVMLRTENGWRVDRFDIWS